MKKALKRSLSILLAVTIIFSSAYAGLSEVDFGGFFAVKAKALDDIIDNTTTIRHLTFTLSDDGRYYSITDCNEWATSDSPTGEFVIPSTYNGLPVKSIGDNAFEYCAKIKSVKIPDSVTSIGVYAFSDCTLLESITIPDSVVNIGKAVFWGCENLSSIRLPNNFPSIGSHAFYNCDRLSSIVIPDSVTQIGRAAFESCNNLKTVVLGNNVRTIDEHAFHSCVSLSDIEFPNSLTSIGLCAFRNCDSLTSIVIPDSVTSIGDAAFDFCDNLESVIISNNIVSTGGGTFWYCSSIVSIIIPNSVSVIGEQVFGGCESLTSIVIPDSVKTIESGAFNYCENLDTVYFWGSEEQWNNIEIGSGNSWLTGADIHFNSGEYSINYHVLSNSGTWFDLHNNKVKMESELDKFVSGKVYETIDNAIVEYNGRKKNVSANRFFVTFPNLSYDINITAPNFQKYIIPAAVAESFKENSVSNFSVYMTKDREDRRPYISSVFGRVHDDKCIKEYKELQSSSLDIEKDKTYDIIITADLKGEDAATYYLSQDSEHRTPPNYTGVFSQADLYNVFDVAKPIYAYAVTKSGKVTEPVTIKLEKDVGCKELNNLLLSSKINILGSDLSKITISDKIPVIGGTELSVDIFEIPVGIEYEGDRVRISLGRDFFKKSNETSTEEGEDGVTTSTKKEEEWIEFKECCKDINDEMKSANSLTEKVEKYKKAKEQRGFRNKDIKSNSKKGFKVDASYLGYLEGYIIDGNLIYSDFSLGAALDFIANYTVNTAIGPVPAYFYIEGGAEGAVAFNLARKFPDENIPVKFDTTISAVPKAKVGGGVGTKGVGSLGVYGSLKFPFKYECLSTHATLDLTGKVGVEGEFLIFCSFKNDLLSGTWNLVDSYWGAAPTSLGAFSNSVYGDIAQIMFSNNSNASSVQYTLASRDYAESTSGWLGYSNESLSGMQVPLYNAGIMSGTTVTELQTSVYKNSQTQLVQFGDKVMLAYIEDCAERDTYNRYRLMYTVYNPSTNTWTQPKAVYDSGKMDASPSLATDGENVYVAWQTVNTIVADSTEEAMYDAMNNMEIYSAKYDEETDSFVDITQHTSNSIYDYSPYVTVENGSATVYWVNAKSTDFATDGMSIHSSKNTSNTLVYDNLNYIVSLKASGSEVSYSMDTDGDLTTVSDIKLFTNGVQVGEDVLEETDIVTNFAYGDFNGKETLFYSDGGTVYYVSDGLSKEAFSDNTGIADSLHITNLNNNLAVIYTQLTDKGSELRISTLENDTWSEPVYLTDIGCSLSNVDVVSVNGKVYSVFDRTQTTEVIDEEIDDAYLEYGQTDLCMLTSEGYYDLEVSNIGYDEGDISIGSSAPFIVVLENKGTETINSIEFVVSDALGFSQSITKEVNLAPGAIDSVELEYVAQENYAVSDLTVVATIVGCNDIDTTNNNTTAKIGRTDVSIGKISVERLGDIFRIKCEVVNDSLIDCKNTVLSFSYEQTEKITPIGTVNAKSLGMFDLIVAKDELNFDENEVCTLTFNVSTDSEEIALGNNENTITIGNTPKLEEHVHNFVNNICDDCGINAFTYDISDDGVTITGYTGTDTEISIPKAITGLPVIAIGASAFADCKDVTSVTIPDSVKNINSQAFYNCPSLTAIIVDEGNSDYSSVDGILFNKNKSILIQYPAGITDTTYIIPDSVTEIDGYAFYSCTNLTSVVFPDTVTTVGVNAFYNCSDLASVYITDIKAWCSIDFDGYVANPVYYAKNLYLNGELITDVIIPEGITSVGDYVFYNCANLNSIKFSDSVTEIGAYAFNNCSNLKEVGLPNSEVSIGKNAFANIGITELTLPENVASIGSSAFSGCMSLQKINYNAINCTIGVTNIFTAMNNHPFKNSSNITEVFIGKNVETIPGLMFYGRGSITSVYITDMAHWCSINFKDNYANPMSVAEKFYLKDDLVTELVIPDNVDTIGDYTFYNFTGITSVAIPSSVTNIGNSTFKNCNNMQYVFYKGSESDWSGIAIGTDNIPLTDAVIHYNAIGHIYSDEWTIDLAPTCTEEGGKSHHCTGTGCEEKADITVITATGHNYEIINAVSAHPHTTSYKCSFCDREKTETPIISNCIECIYGTETPIKGTENTIIDFDKFIIKTTVQSIDDIVEILWVSENSVIEVEASYIYGNLELYGTGTVITVFDGNEYIGDFTLVVEGDTNGDSVCDALDAWQVALVSNGLKSIDGAYTLAADSNSDDVVDIIDYQAIVNKAVS